MDRRFRLIEIHPLPRAFLADRATHIFVRYDGVRFFVDLATKHGRGEEWTPENETVRDDFDLWVPVTVDTLTNGDVFVIPYSIDRRHPTHEPTIGIMTGGRTRVNFTIDGKHKRVLHPTTKSVLMRIKASDLARRMLPLDKRLTFPESDIAEDVFFEDETGDLGVFHRSQELWILFRQGQFVTPSIHEFPGPYRRDMGRKFKVISW
jgi:hypothetical protein